MAAVRRGGAAFRPSGFTLLEVTITLAVLGVGLLALLVAQVQAMSGEKQGKHATTAATLAQDQIELIQRMPFSSADLDVTAWRTAPWINRNLANEGQITTRVSQPGGDVTEQTYTVQYRVLADPGGNADLKQLDLEVIWVESDVSNNRPTRTGQPTAAVSTFLVNNDR